MKCLVVVSCLLAVAVAEPGIVGAAHAAVAPLTVATAAVIPPSISTQHHAQDELGQYSYGYNGGPSAKEEVRAADGSVVGSYSYVDANGIVQSAQYASDPINGFRVAATNDPSPAASLALNAAPVVVAAAPAHAVVAAGGLAAAPAIVAANTIAADSAYADAAHIAAKAALLGRKKRGILGAAHAGILAAPAALVAPAVVAAAPGSTVVTVPGTSAYSFATNSLHPAQIVPASPQVAIAAGLAAPGLVVDSHLAAKAALLGRKKRSPGILGAGAIGLHGALVATPSVVAAGPGTISITNPPFRSFSYSAVAGHPAQIVPAGPAVVAAPALVAPAALAAPAVVAHAPAALAAPAVVAHAPAAAALIGVTGSSQVRTQDALGQYSYTYADANSVKSETRALDGTTVGGYSYVDGNGLVQSVKYAADPHNGFRVAATNLPVGPH